MAQGAPKGNAFWQLRSRHGRHRIFKTPENLWDAAQEYFQATDKRKWVKTEFNGKDAVECQVPTSAPYTLTGMFIFMDIVRSTWDEQKTRKGFAEVIARIEQVIFTQKFEGATVGAYNANIIARDLGLVDKQEVNQTKFKVTRKG